MVKVHKILVIDDDLIFLKIAEMLLKIEFKDSVEVFTAKDLQEIDLKMKEKYDMILIDLNMPEISGWQVIERYEEKLKDPDCSALICSSSIDPDDHQKANEMNDVIEEMISKPIDVAILKKYL
jgi:CheY-like chemotaxis protein